MQEYHCQHPHPRRPGPCDAFFFRGRFQGEIEIKCWRCHQSTTLDSRKAYTESTLVDKTLVTV